MIISILVVLVIILLKILLPGKGKIAENRVHNKLMKLSKEYHVIDNALFESNGRSTEIDHIVVSPYGVFVIETKGYQGWISGSEYGEYWTQNIYGNKNQLYNPILQNEGHVRFLSYLLKDLGQITFVPIVVFNNDATIKVLIQDHIVVNRTHLTKAILRSKKVVISGDQQAKIISIINENAKIGKHVKRQHIYYANAKKKENDDKIRNGICPRCGGTLTKRQGKNGRFYGCSNYPECKFTTSSL